MKLFDIILGAITIGLLGEDGTSEEVSGQEVHNYDYSESTYEYNEETNLYLAQDLQAEQELQTIAKAFILW